MSANTEAISRIAKHLDEAAAPADQAAACATIAIICAQPTPPENLDGICEKLLKLLDVAEDGVKVIITIKFNIFYLQLFISMHL